MAVISEPGQMTRHATSASGDWAALQVSCKALHFPDVLHCNECCGITIMNQWQISFTQHPYALLVLRLHAHAFVAETLGITTTAVADCLCATQVP